MDSPATFDNQGDGLQARKPPGPRLYHKKSRKGCLRCKSRRVKCDEKRPACTGCSRHGMECVYPDESQNEVTAAPSRARRSLSNKSPMSHEGFSPTTNSSGALSSNTDSQSESMHSAASPVLSRPPPASSPAGTMGDIAMGDDDLSIPGPPIKTEDDPLDLPESRERRLTELRLLHHYLLTQSNTFGSSSLLPARDGEDGAKAFVWVIEMVDMAFDDDTILHALLAHAALSKWTMVTDEAEKNKYHQMQQQYLALALREQRRNVGSLSASNADYVALASITILSHSFALVQTVSTEPWEPPIEWLQMGRGAGQVFMVARAHLAASADDRITRFLKSPPEFDPDEMFTHENRAHLVWLLDAPPGVAADREMEDKITKHFYEHILSYIGWTEKAVKSGSEPIMVTVRRFAAFAIWVPDVLTSFLAQRRPRALVAMAYFFALWIPYEMVWMVRDTGSRQVRAIYRELPMEWRGKLDPLVRDLGLEI